MTAPDHLTAKRARDWVSAGDTYVPTGEVVHAEQLTEETSWATSSGATLRGEAGDWQVNDSHGGTWTVDKDVFKATYEPLGDGRFRKTAPVRARRLEHPAQLETLEGVDTLGAGDWIVMNETGECWGMPDNTFHTRYRKTDDD